MNKTIFSLIAAVCLGMLQINAQAKAAVDPVDINKAKVKDVGKLMSDDVIWTVENTKENRVDTVVTSEEYVLWRSQGNYEMQRASRRSSETDVIARHRAMLDQFLNENNSDGRYNSRRAQIHKQSGTFQKGVFEKFHYYVFIYDYPSIDGTGKPVTLSAIGAGPNNDAGDVQDVIMGCHITITSDEERPSAQTHGFKQTDCGVMMSLAGEGKFKLDWYFLLCPDLLTYQARVALFAYSRLMGSNDAYKDNLIIMADYEGYGTTRHRAHPYLNQPLTARQEVDATRYGIELYKNSEELKDIHHDFRHNFRTISAGYSQGGSVALACHRFVEENDLTEELHFAGSICGDGPYDPVSTLGRYVKDSGNKTKVSMPVVMPLIVKGMLDSNPYMTSNKLEDYFRPEFLATGVVDWITSKEYTTDEITKKFKDIGGDFDGDGKIMLQKIMNDECYNFFCSQNIDTKALHEMPERKGPMEDLFSALMSNDVVQGWTPKHRIKMYHEKYDDVVPIENADRAEAFLGGWLNLTRAKEHQNHVEAGTQFFKGGMGDLWDCSPLFYDYKEKWCNLDWNGQTPDNDKKPWAYDNVLTGKLNIGGTDVDAQFTKLTDETVAVGNGYNTCVAQLKVGGKLIIPSTVTIGDKEYKVTEIKKFAFRLCDKIDEVVIGENVERVGDFAFMSCANIKSIELPKSMKTLGRGAFLDCYDALQSVTCLGSTPPVWESNDIFARHSIYDETEYMLSPDIDLNVPDPEVYKEAKWTNEAIGWKTAAGWASFGSLGVEHKGSSVWDGGEGELKVVTEPDGQKFIYISSAAQLAALNAFDKNGDGYNNFENVTVMLDGDIDLLGRDFTKYIIGGETDHKFKGTFDGKGHTISNLYLNHDNSEYDRIALFGQVESGTIKNLKLQNIRVVSTMKRTEDVIISGLVGDLYQGTVENCALDGVNFIGDVNETPIYTQHEYFGGITGFTRGAAVINQCYVKGTTVRGSTIVHGIAGGTGDPYIVKNSYFSGKIDCSDERSSAITRASARVENCYYEEGSCERGTVTGTEPAGCKKTKAELMQPLFFGSDNNAWVYRQNDYPELSVFNHMVGGVTFYSKNVATDQSSNAVPGYVTVNSSDDSHVFVALKKALPGSEVTLADMSAEYYEDQYGHKLKYYAVGPEAFADCSTLQTVKLPETVKTIGDRAFKGCTSLTQANIPTTLVSLGNAAFCGDVKLAQITLPATLMEMGDSCFMNCQQLTEVTIPTSLTTIADRAFDGCTNLATVNLPATLLNMGEYAFKDCKLTSGITMPQMMTVWKNGLFYQSGLESITIPEAVTSIGSKLFGDNMKTLTSKTTSVPLAGIGAFSEQNIKEMRCFVMPELIEDYEEAPVWEDLFNLLPIGSVMHDTDFGVEWYLSADGKRLDIVAKPGVTQTETDEVPWVGYLPTLTQIYVHEGVKYIGKAAFKGSVNVSMVKISTTIEKIGQEAYAGCTKLMLVECLGATPATLGTAAFDNCAEGLLIKVPETGLATYKTNWATYKDAIISSFQYKTVTIPAGEYATFYCDRVTMINRPFDVYVVTGVTAKSVIVEKIGYLIPAKTPVLVKNTMTTDEETTFSLTVLGVERPENISDAFKGSVAPKELEASTDTKSIYVCNGKEFVRAEVGGTLGANRCWLEVSASEGAANRRSIIIGEGTTGVNEALGDEGDALTHGSKNEESAGAWYDMSGRKLSGLPSAKGVYIHNGRKVVVK